MVLKLKEIFQYTHQDVDSDFEDEVPLSQPPPKKSPAKCSQQSKAGRAGAKRAGASRQKGKRKQVATASSEIPVGMAGDDLAGSSGTDCAAPKEGSKKPHHPEGAEEQKRLAVSPERWSLEDDGEEPMLSSSQQSAVSSLSGSDISFDSQR